MPLPLRLISKNLIETLKTSIAENLQLGGQILDFITYNVLCYCFKDTAEEYSLTRIMEYSEREMDIVMKIGHNATKRNLLDMRNILYRRVDINWLKCGDIIYYLQFGDYYYEHAVWDGKTIKRCEIYYSSPIPVDLVGNLYYWYHNSRNREPIEFNMHRFDISSEKSLKLNVCDGYEEPKKINFFVLKPRPEYCNIYSASEHWIALSLEEELTNNFGLFHVKKIQKQFSDNIEKMMNTCWKFMDIASSVNFCEKRILIHSSIEKFFRRKFPLYFDQS